MIFLYVSQACLASGFGGWSVLQVKNGQVTNEWAGFAPGTTLRAMAMQAAYEATRKVWRDGEAWVVTDSGDVMRELAGGWRDGADDDVAAEARKLLAHRHVSWVRRRPGDKFSARAEELARKVAVNAERAASQAPRATGLVSA